MALLEPTGILETVPPEALKVYGGAVFDVEKE